MIQSPFISIFLRKILKSVFFFKSKKKQIIRFYTNTLFLFTRIKKINKLNFSSKITKMKSRIKFKLAKKIQGFLLGRIISFFLVRKISHLFDKSINLCLKNLD